MPWHVKTSAQCPVGKPWAVIKDEDGKVIACHPTKQKALKHLAALNINVPDVKKKGKKS